MAKVVNVITPFFFSENEPYMVVYDVRKIYPDLTTFEAKESFLEEMRVGQSEEINLRKFTISDLTDNEYTSVRYSATNSKEQDFRIGVYDNFDKRETAKKILNLFVKHGVLTLCD